MTAPENVEVHELYNSTIWFDESGILHTVAKKVPQQSLAEVKKNLEIFKQIAGEEKVCLLSDSTNSPPVNKELRDFAAEVFPSLVKAIAIMSRSAVGKMAANLFFSLKKQPYPVRFFDNEDEARTWLKQYL